MRNFNVTAVSVDSKQIVIDKNEAAVRLKIPRNYTNETVSRCEENLRRVLNCKYAYINVSVQMKSDNICDLGFGDIESYDLAKALKGCNEAYILGVTIGIGADRLISRLAVTSPAESFITDALASAAAESLCDYADNILRKEGEKPFRFAPGYGDMPLEQGAQILAVLDAARRIGLTVTPNYLMIPRKSVTAILGISDHPQKLRKRGCEVCSMFLTCPYRKEGLACHESSDIT